ncbi:MAG: hypothetical protein LBR45_04095 [Bacteroidales bacterium]|jgi:riboflavin kinase/FMN adenylyltransferase|nr:hypothetical protein [Bacteroidales bacterium]
MMKIFNGINEWHKVKNPIVTVGSFDGVHLAHRSIISLLNHYAEIEHGESVLVTFYPHPRLVIPAEEGFRERFRLITIEEEKMRCLEDAGLQNVLVLPFTVEFASLPSNDFIKKILVDVIHAKKVITGFNHSFGHDRNGGYEDMLEQGKHYGFSVDKYPEYIVHNRKISSTHIRELIRNGKIMEANELLGYNFMAMGKCEGGVLEIDNPVKIIPSDGLYLCRVYAEELLHYAVCEIRERKIYFKDLSFITANVAATAQFIKEL